MRYGSLFSGIGGLDLGFDLAGFVCAWQVENDPFCRRVLDKHWPTVPKFGDVQTVGNHNLEPVDIVIGGFPCQDLSQAGKRRGLGGERSGLWFEFARVVREVVPRFVVVENVPGIFVSGLGRVLGDLAASGYDAEWFCLSANSQGAPHIRDRAFIIAHRGHAHGQSKSALPVDARQAPGVPSSCPVPNAKRHGVRDEWQRRGKQYSEPGASVAPDDGPQGALSHAHGPGPTHGGQGNAGRELGPGRCAAGLGGTGQGRPRAEALPHADGGTGGRGADLPGGRTQGRTTSGGAGASGSRYRWWDGPSAWATEPGVGMLANGIPDRVARLRALGNAVVPQVALVVANRVAELADMGA